VEAKSSVQLPVQCQPTTTVASPCRLILSCTRRDGSGVNATTLVFALNPNILVRRCRLNRVGCGVESA